jgi:glycosyltransferase involved in cell wall biosynthesis
VHQENAGAAAARNRGVGIADGELLAFQDSDDVWEPAFLERMVKALEDRERTVVFASHTIASLTGEVETVPPHPLPDPARAMLRRNFASTQAVLLPAVLARATPFDAALPRFQDWDLWLSMLEQGVDFEHVPEVLVHLSRQADSISEGDPGLRAFALQRIFKKHFRLLARDPVAIPRLVARAWLRGRAVRPRGRAGSA